MRTRSHPHAKRKPAMSSTMRGTEPEDERVAMERTYTRSLMSGLSTEDMRIRSPNRAPPVRGELGSTASRATRWPSPAQAVIKASTSTDLPTPGAPVMAMVCQPSFEDAAADFTRSCSASEPFSILDSKRAIERRSPAMACCRSSSTLAPPSSRRFPMPVAALTNTRIVFFRGLLNEIEDL